MASLLKWVKDREKNVSNIAKGVFHAGQAVVAQINPADGNRTAKTVLQKGAAYAPNPQASVKQQAQAQYKTVRKTVQNTGKAVAKPAVQLANTAGALGVGLKQLPTLAEASLHGNDQQYAAALKNANINLNHALQPNAGLMHAGTLFKNPEDASGFHPEKVAAKAIGTGTQLATFALPEAKVGTGVAKVAARVATNAGIGAAGSAAAQYTETGKVKPVQVAKDAAIASGLGEAGHIVQGLRNAPRDIREHTLKIATNDIKPQNVPVSRLTSYEGAPDKARVQFYKDQINSGRPVKPIIALKDSGGKFGIEDGKHRFQAYKELGLRNIPTKVTTPKALQMKLQGGFIGSAPEDTVFKNNPMSVENILKQKQIKAPESNPIGSKTAELPLYNTSKVSWLDKAFRSTLSIIERQGEAGKALATKLQQARDTHETYLGQLQKQLPTVTSLARRDRSRILPGGDFENFVHATQGIDTPKTAEVAQAVQEWQKVHPQIRQRAVNAGLDVGDLGPTYYPHFINYDHIFKDKNTYNQAVNHLVQSGQAPDAEAAIKLLSHARDVSRNREFGNLEASRVIDLPFYDKTPNSLIGYLNGSAKRIAHVEHFGKGDEEALKLIAQAGLQGADTEAMKNAFDVAVGAKRYSPTADKISGGIRKYVTTTRLGLGAITNVSQNVNTGVVTGHFRTMLSGLKQLSPETRSFVEDTGVIADAVLNDLKGQAGYSSFTSKVFGKAVNKITAPGFGTVEKMNRSIAATAGRDYALRLAQRGDEKTLRKLGVTGVIKNNTLTDTQQIQAARKVVEKTQFKVDPQDLPGWVDSPGGKLVAQFRTFSYSQSKFISNEILKPLAHGQTAPLARFLFALPLGYGLYEAKRAIAGRPEETSNTKKGLQAAQNIGGAGLVFDLYQSMNPLGSKYLPSDRRQSMVTGAVGGPAVGVATQGIGAASDLIQRKNTPKDDKRLDGKVVIAKNADTYTDATPAARFGLQQIPVVGTAVKNRLLPFDKESNADAGKSTVAAKKAKKDKAIEASLAAPFSTLSIAESQKKKDDKAYQDAYKKQLTEPERKLLSMNKDEKQRLLNNKTITQGQLDKLNSKVASLKKQYHQETKTTTYPKGMNGNDVAILKKHASMSADEQRNALKTQPDYQFKLERAQYEKKKHEGSLTTAQDIQEQDKLAKLKIGASFDPKIRDLYSLSKTDLQKALSKQTDPVVVQDQLNKYDSALVAASAIKEPKYSSGFSVSNAKLSNTAVKEYSDVASRNGIPPAIFAALIKQESGGNQAARSPVGAIGITQLMPDTARGLGVNPFDARDNLEGGARYLKSMYDHFGNWPDAIRAYHGGTDTNNWGPKTQNYVSSILSMVNSVGGKDVASILNTLSLNDPGTHYKVNKKGKIVASKDDTPPTSGRSSRSTGSGSSSNDFSGAKLASILNTTNAAIRPPKAPAKPNITIKTNKTPAGYKHTTLRHFAVAKPRVSTGKK